MSYSRASLPGNLELAGSWDDGYGCTDHDYYFDLSEVQQVVYVSHIRMV